MSENSRPAGSRQNSAVAADGLAADVHEIASSQKMISHYVRHTQNKIFENNVEMRQIAQDVKDVLKKMEQQRVDNIEQFKHLEDQIAAIGQMRENDGSLAPARPLVPRANRNQNASQSGQPNMQDIIIVEDVKPPKIDSGVGIPRASEGSKEN